MRIRPAALAAVGLTLVLVSWVAATRPFGGPDESSHYLRALGIANGQLVGPKVPFVNFLATPTQAAWIGQDTRGVMVPARMAPPGLSCVGGRPDVTGTCLAPSPNGDYQPLPYLLPAVGIALAHNARTALWLSRAASAAQVLVFLLLAVFLAWGSGGWSLLGVLLAVTPTVLFIGSLMNPDGLELAASIAFLAGLLRLSRNPRAFPAWGWGATAVSGAVAVLSWQLGPFFVALDLILVGVLMGRDRCRAVLSARPRAVGAVGVVLVGALALYVLYGAAADAFHSTLGFTPIVGSLRSGLGQLGLTLRQAVGGFGFFLQVSIPAILYLVWWALVVGACAVALFVAQRRDRTVFLLAIAGALIFPVIFYAWAQRRTGFGMQGRYAVPVLVVIPMLAGELAERGGRPLRAAWLSLFTGGAIGVVAIAQLAAWWTSARQTAGAPNAHWFISHAVWSPPLTWWPWTLLVVLGTCAVLGAGVTQTRASRGLAHGRRRITVGEPGP